MKRWSKCLMALTGALLLTFAGKTTVQAAEAPAPFTADQLLGAVNVQCANVSSLQQVLAESVQMTEASTGMTISANMVMDAQQSRTVSHTTTSMVMSMLGISQGAVTENYSALSGTTLYSYTADESGAWKATCEALTPEEAASFGSDFNVDGIDLATAVVTVDGSVYRVRGVMDAESMEKFTDLLGTSGVVPNGAFPVVLDIDGATLLPVSLTVAMQNMSMSDMPGVTASANVVVTYGGYNQYDALAVPASVIANAA